MVSILCSKFSCTPLLAIWNHCERSEFFELWMTQGANNLYMSKLTNIVCRVDPVVSTRKSSSIFSSSGWKTFQDVLKSAGMSCAGNGIKIPKVWSRFDELHFSKNGFSLYKNGFSKLGYRNGFEFAILGF